MSNDIDIGQIGEALNNKADRDLHNTQPEPVGDYVVEFQAPTAANNYTWYRLYKSGWVEQGGTIENVGGTTSYTINLVKNFSDTSYYAIFIALGGPRNASSDNNYVISKTTQNFIISKNDGITTKIMWEAKGFTSL